jgi:hypothetical protein
MIASAIVHYGTRMVLLLLLLLGLGIQKANK